MNRSDVDAISNIYKKIAKILGKPESPDSKECAELIKKLPDVKFNARLANTTFIDLLAKNANIHTLRAAYKKYPEEEKIFVAACLGWKKTVAHLLKKGAEINASLISGQTLLYLAAQYGRTDLVKQLLAAKAEVNSETVLHEIIAANDFEALAARLHCIDSVDPTVTSPLCAATEGKHHEIMSLLLEELANVHQVSAYGKLIQAGSINGTFEAIRPLAYMEGYSSNYCPDLTMFYTAMHIAAKNDDVTALEMLLERGAGLNQSARQDNFSSSTPLHVAIKAGADNAAAYLIKKGADVNRLGCDYLVPAKDEHTNSNGLAPLHFAAEKGNTAIITLLLEQDVLINVKGEESYSYFPANGYTPLDFAAINDQLDAFKLLSKRGGRIHNWNEVMDNVVVDHYNNRKKMLREESGASNQIEILQLLLARLDKPELDYNKYLKAVLTPSFENNSTINFEVVNILLSHTRKWNKTIEELVTRNRVEMCKSVLARPDLPKLNMDKYLAIALKPNYENKHRPDLSLIESLLAHGAKVTDEQIQQTLRNGLEYLVEPLKTAKAEQDRLQQLAEEAKSAPRAGFFTRVLGGCIYGVTSPNEEARP